MAEKHLLTPMGLEQLRLLVESGMLPAHNGTGQLDLLALERLLRHVDDSATRIAILERLVEYGKGLQKKPGH